MNKNFIGVTGSNASGKGEIGKFLVGLGYTYISLSDILRSIATSQNLPLDRIHLTQIGQDQRKLHGPGFLAKKTLETIDPALPYIIDSIRHPEEVKIFQAGLQGFELWSVDSAPQTRFMRSQKRGRGENATSLDAFIAQENKEKGSQDHEQQLHLTIAMAKHHIKNDDSLESFQKKILILLS